MEMPRNPILFLDGLISRHKRWLKNRVVLGETIAYMGENVDQPGRGLDWLRHNVYNDVAKTSDPSIDNNDLSLLQLYKIWRKKYNLRPIQQWDGTKLRPWLPPHSNPQVPFILDGNLHLLSKASYRHEAWEQHLLSAGVDTSLPFVVELDVLGNIAESYLREISRHSVWSAPTELTTNTLQSNDNHSHNLRDVDTTVSQSKLAQHHHSELGNVRLYRHNDLNNEELSLYSIRFWGFLEWVDSLRKEIVGSEQDNYEHDEDSDISFMDQFNANHFPWHDNIYNTGVADDWRNEFGTKKSHIFNRGTQGYALEFLKFHSDLIEKYNEWLKKMDYPETSAWRKKNEPFEPGVHHSAYMLKDIWSGNSFWSLKYFNGRPIDFRLAAPELFDPDLSSFSTIAELGYYFEGFRGIHGMGHVENCDFRDQYLNNYSLRFFHWHQWIDDKFKLLQSKELPEIYPGTELSDSFKTLTERGLFKPTNFSNYFNDRKWPVEGRWKCLFYDLSVDVFSGQPKEEFDINVVQDEGRKILMEMTSKLLKDSVFMTISPDSRFVRYNLEPYSDEHQFWDDDKSMLNMNSISGSDRSISLRGKANWSWQRESSDLESITGFGIVEQIEGGNSFICFIMVKNDETGTVTE